MAEASNPIVPTTSKTFSFLAEFIKGRAEAVDAECARLARERITFITTCGLGLFLKGNARDLACFLSNRSGDSVETRIQYFVELLKVWFDPDRLEEAKEVFRDSDYMNILCPKKNTVVHPAMYVQKPAAEQEHTFYLLKFVDNDPKCRVIIGTQGQDELFMFEGGEKPVLQCLRKIKEEVLPMMPEPSEFKVGSHEKSNWSDEEPHDWCYFVVPPRRPPSILPQTDQKQLPQ